MVSEDLTALINSVQSLNASVSRLQTDTSAFQTDAIEKLALTTKGLEKQAELNRKNIERGRKRTYALIVSVALDIVLSVVLAITLNGVNDNARSIHDIQQVTSDEVLCPLYDLLLAAKDRPPSNLTPEQLAERTEAYVVVQRGYDALHCVPTK